VPDLAGISNLPKPLRARLSDDLPLGLPEVERRYDSADGTVRFLLRLTDGKTVETVWMPEDDRATICISSQIGCPVDCKFCLTALLGLERSLTAGEIVGQVLRVARTFAVNRLNIVMMGQGEPLLNLANVVKATRLLTDPEGIAISPRRITLSTAGIIPKIAELGREPVRPKLAISLNASSDDLRSRLMPINRKWNLERLISAARDFPLRNREKLTFEYVLLDGVNDSPENARELAELIRGVRAKVNLIALNPGPGIEFRTPAHERVLQFQNILMTAGVPAFVRRPRGRDIYAACGQLKRTVELALAS
jgi:23S rRNA (adenine2503-C2)-methyltransferase